MSDDADRTDARTAGELESMLNRVRQHKGMVPCGACYYCGEDVSKDRTFCNAECRDEWQTEQRILARAGRR